MTPLHSLTNLFVSNKTFLAVSFLFFLQQALSNVHSVRATATEKDPLTWNFNPKVLSPVFTSLILYREILVVTLQYPLFVASISDCQTVYCINPFVVKPLTHTQS